MQITPIERAFALAATGHFKSKTEIARAMQREGFTVSEINGLAGTTLSRQLSAICAKARAVH